MKINLLAFTHFFFIKMSKTPINSLLLIVSGVLIFLTVLIKTAVIFNFIECTLYINYAEYLLFIFFSLPFYAIVTRYVMGKRIENKQLKKTILELESIIDASALISKTDRKGKITYVNKKFIEVSGYPEKELIGQDHNIVNSGKHLKDFWRDMYIDAAGNKNIWNNIVINRSKAGELYWVDTYIKALFDPQTNQLSGFISIRQDITKLISALEQLNKKEREINDVLDALNMSSAMAEFCVVGRVLKVNDNFLKLTGYTRDSIIGLHQSVLVPTNYSTPKQQEKFWTDLNNGSPKSGEYPLVKRDGSVIWIQATYSPIVDENSIPYRIILIFTDVTLEVEQREELNKKNAYLEHAAKILRHDMHSGINTYIPKGIKSLERRLTPEVVSELKLDSPLKLIKDGLAHAQKIYSGVKEFTNLVKKDATLNRVSCDLRQILKEYLAKTAYSKQVIIEELPTVEVNEALFCTAIDNLIRNGLKYNDSATKFVKISMEREAGVISVQDNGRGMTQREFETFSQPYSRKKSQSEGGTGLGLNICVAILKEHGFSITCEKNKTGTKLKIKLL